YEEMLGYEILTAQGKWESFERELYDMMRSTMIKYMLQARMGRMDGIFVAYHNVERIFGFQYLPIMDIDRGIHGQVDPCLGDQEFKISLRLLNEALEMATEKFPGKSLRVHFEAAPSPENVMWIFAEPMEEGEIDAIQGKTQKSMAEFEADAMGMEKKDDTSVEQTGAGSAAANDEAVLTAPGEVPVDYTWTTSPADPKFIKKIDQPAPAESELKPLFAATLLLQNLVNGLACDKNRP
ncbi:hypothetical protein LTR53_018472, partial [Teratosphaeriaceae sp. CCFEE 6253]